MFRLEALAVAVPAGPARATVSLVLATGAVAVVQVAPAAGMALSRAVIGLSRPLSGRVLVGDLDVTGLPPARRHIGYVPAGGGLLPHLTVRENIAYRLRRDLLVAELAADRLRSVIDRLELDHLLDRRPDTLCGHERLRVGIARAMVALPEVLMIDLPEPGPDGPLAAELLSRVQWQQGTAELSTVVATGDEAVLAMASTVVTARVTPVPAAAPQPVPAPNDAPARGSVVASSALIGPTLAVSPLVAPIAKAPVPGQAPGPAATVPSQAGGSQSRSLGGAAR